MSSNVMESLGRLEVAAWDPPDEEMVAAALEGDPEAFDVLTLRHRAAALRTATYVVGRDRAEDVVQDALLLAYRALRTLEDPSKFPRWLCTITRFRALRVGRSEGRRRGLQVTLSDAVLNSFSELACAPREEEKSDETLLEGLRRLPPSYAEVLRLHFLHGFPHKKIAEFLGISLPTVKWRCHRGKELLRGVLETGPVVAAMDRECARCDVAGTPIAGAWSGTSLPTRR